MHAATYWGSGQVFHFIEKIKRKVHKSNDRALKNWTIFVSTENGTRSFWRLNRFLIHALELKLWDF